MTDEHPLRDSLTRPEPEPLQAVQVPTGTVVLIGMGLWAVALAVTLLVPSLHQGDRSWWPWTCVAGILLGALGLTLVRRGRGNFSDAE